MRKVLGNIFVGFCVILIIVMSILLLSYNEYRVSEFGNNTLLILDEDMLQYKSGSLLVINGKGKDSLKEGDFIFYYDTATKNVKTVLSEIKTIYNEFGGIVSYELVDGTIVSEEHVIGSTNKTKEIKSLGTFLSILESKWGNLFLVVVPAFLLFIYEIYNVIIEYKVYKLHKVKNANN